MSIAHHTFCSRAGSQRDAGLARFRCNQDSIVLAANLADEAVVDVDPHHGFAINDFLLMHDHFLDQRVQEFFGQFGDIRVLLHQGSEILRVTTLLGIVSQQGLNLIVPVFQLLGFGFVQFFASYNAENFTEERVYYHSFPKEGKLTREQAIEIALQAVHEVGDERVGAAWIDDLKCNAVFDVNAWVDALYQSNEPLWIVTFFGWDAEYRYWAQRAYAYLTEDGEVVLADLDLYSNG